MIKPSSYLKRFSSSVLSEKPRGGYRMMDVRSEGMTVKVTLRAGAQMNYHCHDYRNEVWTVLSGRGETLVDGMTQRVEPGDVITILSGCKHRVKALTDLMLIEVQLGQNITVHDKKKFSE